MNELNQQLRKTFEKVSKPKVKNRKTRVLVLRMNRNFFISLILVLLIAVSSLQAIELNKLRSRLKAQPAQAVGETSSGTGSQDSNLPANLQNLPSQVGGC